jgi:hypothetical protein
MIKKRRLKQLAWREYLPMAGLIALWAVIVVAIGHADAARLLAAVAFIRAAQLLTRLTTSASLRQRIKAPKPVRRQAKRFAFCLQATALIMALLLVAALAEGLKAIGQQQIAAFLPFIALGMPARYLRFADVRTASPYFRLALSGGGVVMVLVGWAAGWHSLGMAFAFGAREWIAYTVLRWWPKPPHEPKEPVTERLRFREVALVSAVVGRRLLTYRLTKVLLTVFGPFGNIAARTGRGLNWHRKIEPYLPHHLGGFILFSLGAFAVAAFMAIRVGEPAAMIAAGGISQVGAAALNVVLFWRWLPAKGSGEWIDDEDDE